MSSHARHSRGTHQIWSCGGPATLSANVTPTVSAESERKWELITQYDRVLSWKVTCKSTGRHDYICSRYFFVDECSVVVV